LTREEFAKCLNDRFEMVDATWLDCDGNDADGNWDQKYAVYQYFNNAAKSLVACKPPEKDGKNSTIDKRCKIGSPDDAVWNYRFVPPEGKGTLSYYICCTEGAEDRCDKKGEDACPHKGQEGCVRKTEYFLPVRAVWAKLFDMGVGFLIFELEYWGRKRITYPACISLKEQDPADQAEDVDLKDVCIINERGRRVFPPFLSKAANEESKGIGLSANAIALVWDRGHGEPWDYFSDDMVHGNNTFSEIIDRKERRGSVEPLVPDFISYFLTRSYGKTSYTADIFDCNGRLEDNVIPSDEKNHYDDGKSYAADSFGCNGRPDDKDNPSDKKIHYHYVIEPIIDERMFTMCYLNDKSFSDRVSGNCEKEDSEDSKKKEQEDSKPESENAQESESKDSQGQESGNAESSESKDSQEQKPEDRESENPEDSQGQGAGSPSTKKDDDDYPYLTDRAVMNALYAFGFVDERGACSCKNRKMIKDMLKKHVYARWIDYGTINISTEYSFMCLANSMPPFLTNPFLTQYQQMVYIALAQRASLLSLENRISHCALGMREDEDSKDSKSKRSEPSMGAEIRQLQRMHIYFSSRYLLPEVTSQQQGIELYDMLLDTMLVDKRSQQIDKQINDLFDLKNNEYDLVESRDDRTQNAVLFFIALAGLISLACDLTGSPVTDLCLFIKAIFVIAAVLYVLIRLLGYGFMELWRSLRNRQD